MQANRSNLYPFCIRFFSQIAAISSYPSLTMGNLQIAAILYRRLFQAVFGGGEGGN